MYSHGVCVFDFVDSLNEVSSGLETWKLYDSVGSGSKFLWPMSCVSHPVVSISQVFLTDSGISLPGWPKSE